MDVNEDSGFESFVKRAMESGPALDGERVSELERLAEDVARRRRIRRKSLLWGASTLLAASLAATVAFRVMMPSAGSSIGDAIGLLCEMDGIEADNVQEVSDGDLLLAWQEAPCMDLL